MTLEIAEGQADLNNNPDAQVTAELPAKSGEQVAGGGIGSYSSGITLKSERNSAGDLNGIDSPEAKGLRSTHTPAGVTSDLTPSRLARSLTVAPVAVDAKGVQITDTHSKEVLKRCPLSAEEGTNRSPLASTTPSQGSANDTAFHRGFAKAGELPDSEPENHLRFEIGNGDAPDAGILHNPLKNSGGEVIAKSGENSGGEVIPESGENAVAEADAGSPPLSIAERLSRCAEVCRLSPQDLRRMAVQRLLREFEQNGEIRLRAAKKPVLELDLSPHLSPEQMADFRRTALSQGTTPEAVMKMLIRGFLKTGTTEVKETGEVIDKFDHNLNLPPPPPPGNDGGGDSAPEDDSDNWIPQPDGTSLYDMTDKLPPEEYEQIVSEAEALGITPTEHFTNLVRPVLHRLMRERAARMKAKTETEPDSLTLLLAPGKAARLQEHAAALGCDAGKLAAVLVELMADREKAEETGKPKPRHFPGFGITSKQARRLRRMARLLEITPREFLRWQLNDLLDQLEDPSTGNLEGWTRDMIIWEDEASYERVPVTVDAWLEKRRERLAERRAA